MNTNSFKGGLLGNQVLQRYSETGPDEGGSPDLWFSLLHDK